MLSLEERRAWISRCPQLRGELSPEHSCDDLRSSARIDEAYGLRVQEIESELVDRLSGEVEYVGQQTWVGLNPAMLQTPYERLGRLLREVAPRPGDLVVDLGSGYGRLGLLIGETLPEVRFLGYELVTERVNESVRVAREFGYRNVEFLRQDLADPAFTPVPADLYFIYKFGTGDAIRKSLRDLERLASEGRGFRVVARDTGTQILIEEEFPWLRRPVEGAATGLRECAVYGLH